jgi:hypothetical protein
MAISIRPSQGPPSRYFRVTANSKTLQDCPIAKSSFESTGALLLRVSNRRLQITCPDCGEFSAAGDGRPDASGL